MSNSGTFNEKAFDFYSTLNKVREHFEKHYSQSFTLAQAASIAALEPKYFGKFFRKKVGIGFKEWTTIIRIKFAITAIEQLHRPLVDIAFATGFQELRTFERAFKKRVGVTPCNFRKKIIMASRPAA